MGAHRGARVLTQISQQPVKYSNLYYLKIILLFDCLYLINTDTAQGLLFPHVPGDISEGSEHWLAASI